MYSIKTGCDMYQIKGKLSNCTELTFPERNDFRF